MSLKKDLSELSGPEEEAKHKAPVRSVMCPKCFTFGATMDTRNSERKVIVSSGILDASGNETKRWKTLIHTINCRYCGEITRKVK